MMPHFESQKEYLEWLDAKKIIETSTQPSMTPLQYKKHKMIKVILFILY